MAESRIAQDEHAVVCVRQAGGDAWSVWIGDELLDVETDAEAAFAAACVRAEAAGNGLAVHVLSGPSSREASRSVLKRIEAFGRPGDRGRETTQVS